MKKLFTNDKFYLVMTICGSLGLVVFLFMMYFLSGKEYILSRLALLVEALCVFFLYVSYIKYSKNVMKGMMGALLMAILLAAINSFTALSLPVETVFAAIYLAVAVILFVSHFIINSNHHSKASFIKLNQALCLVYALNLLAWDGMWIIVDQSPMNIIASVINIVTGVGVMASVICVESRLDAYRLDREAAGWTEEAGYPEGYVHQKDR